MNRQDDFQRIVESKIVGVIRGVDAETVVDIATALRAGGVTAIEVTADTPGAMGMIDAVAAELEGEDVIVGAGTVLDPETARAALLAGAEFIVAPTVNEAVIEVCNRYGAVVAPGAATPTEVVTAYEAGADVVKVFPASSLGPEYISSLKGPLGHIPLMPTGGIDLDNAATFINAGGLAVGVGSALVDKQAVANGNFERLTERAEAFVNAIERRQ